MNYDVIKIKPQDLDYIYGLIVKDAKRIYKHEVLDTLPLPKIAFDITFDSDNRSIEYYDFDTESETLHIHAEYPHDTKFSFDVNLLDDGKGLLGFYEPDFPDSMPEEVKDLLLARYSDDLVTDTPNWMGFCGRFINVNRFLATYPPEVVCHTGVRHTEQGGKSPRGKKKSHKPNKVKTYKVYRFKDNLEGIVREHKRNSPNNRYCDAWGVRGHYRHYKDGKVVWVRACVKGKSKDKYVGKEYELFDRKEIAR